MEKYYLFGAGINAYGVIKFFGDVFINIVDNNPDKIGTNFCGYKVISFADFVKKWNGETVIVAAFSKSESVVEQLTANGISNVYVAPLMQNGFWENCDEIIEEFKLLLGAQVFIYGNNPFSKLLAKTLHNNNYGGNIIILSKDDFALCNEEEIFLTECILDKAFLENYNVVDLTLQRIKYKQKLIKYKNIYKGKSCFIIGTGPSLKVGDLELLKKNNFMCFASNSIYNLYDKTKWRPDYYVIADYNVLRKMHYEYLSAPFESKNMFVAEFYNNEFDLPENCERVNLLPFKNKRGFSSDIADFVYSGGTVTYTAMQIAVYMGFEKIYLLGVDCGNSHFYEKDMKNSSNEDWNVDSFKVSYWLAAYKLAKDYADAHGIKIYNATRGGALEVFERVDFDSLFEEDSSKK